jgi:hypothetical protein
MTTESHTTNPSNIIDAAGRFDGVAMYAASASRAARHAAHD